MEKAVQVSVIMSVYNESLEELECSVNSILFQTFKDFEFIIVLDNPCHQILLDKLVWYSHQDQRVKVIMNPINIGLSASLNVAIERSKGEYIVRMDADDFSHPKRIENLMKIAKTCKADVYYSAFYYMNGEGVRTATSLKVPSNRHLKYILSLKNIICHPTVMFDAETIKMIKYSDLSVCEDYELWLRMMGLGCSFYGVNQHLVGVRIREGSMTTTNYFKTYCFEKAIRKHYRKSQQELNNPQLMVMYNKNHWRAKSFNEQALVYHQKLKNQNNESMTRRFTSILWVCVKEPLLMDLAVRTFLASILRKV